MCQKCQFLVLPGTQDPPGRLAAGKVSRARPVARTSELGYVNNSGALTRMSQVHFHSESQRQVPDFLTLSGQRSRVYDYSSRGTGVRS